MHMGTPRPAHTDHTYRLVGSQIDPDAFRAVRGIARARLAGRHAGRRAHERVERGRIAEDAQAHVGGEEERPGVCISRKRSMSMSASLWGITCTHGRAGRGELSEIEEL